MYLTVRPVECCDVRFNGKAMARSGVFVYRVNQEYINSKR